MDRVISGQIADVSPISKTQNRILKHARIISPKLKVFERIMYERSTTIMKKLAR